jgi:hypothetical protein
MARYRRVKCSKCGKFVGRDLVISVIEECISCQKGTKKKKKGNNFSSIRGGKANDLPEGLNEYFFRSSWERNIARWLTANKVNWTFERVSFTFQVSPTSGKSYKRKPWVYIPDFHDIDSDIMYEVKGYLRSEDRSKFRRLKANYPTEFKKMKAICSKSAKTAISFYSKMGVPVIFIEDIKVEYQSLVKNSFWE